MDRETEIERKKIIEIKKERKIRKKEREREIYKTTDRKTVCGSCPRMRESYLK